MQERCARNTSIAGMELVAKGVKNVEGNLRVSVASNALAFGQFYGEKTMTNGKKGSARNAVTHGIFAEILSSGSDSGEAEEFRRLLSGAREAIRPTNDLEEAFVEKLVVLLLRLRRVYKADSQIAPKLFARVSDTLNTKTMYESMLDDQTAKTNKDPTIDSVVRYETSIERQIGRTLSQIQQLRRMREFDANPISQGAQASGIPSSIVPREPEANPQTPRS